MKKQAKLVVLYLGVVVRCRLPQQLGEMTGTPWADLEPIPKSGIVFKLHLLVNAKALTRNFTAEHFPELLFQTKSYFFAIN
ncbi:hypothetical protein EGT49_01960 [Companilactobacillus suantsaicola]|uniref:Uncharacterized protein n=1 Tax=Companilactobacillus suantsaicola TaxID=2487723 RepID=A0A4Z0JPC7_9LACO|nr:hypothetical protein [Companilactobacillus suantsaicola]TGD24900.1 hypothetical protein EGT49_01960 [Companilactobacillus suantsaicola]